MLKNITDIANWEKEYPFLKDVWEFYNTLDILEDKDKHNGKIFSMCHMILNTFGKNREAYDNFCTKLLKNLGHYSENKKSIIRSHDRCNILYNWIYNSKKKHNIPDEIINKCFEDYITITGLLQYSHACSYNLHNSFYEEPIKMTILNIFNNNMQNIINKLMGEYGNDDFSPQDFVCEFVKIYKNIHNTYCATAYPKEGKIKNTCDKLKELKYIYDNYLLIYDGLKNKIPSLDPDYNGYSNKCISQAKDLESVAVSGGNEETFSDSRGVGRNTVSSLPPRDDIGENTSGSMSSTASTALGTVAGASSLLAILYKFTPGRRWIHSGFGRQSGRINNDLYEEGPNELLFNGFQVEDMSSYNARYNIGYGSA